MKIRLENTYATLVEATALESTWLYSFLSYADMSQLMEHDPITHKTVRAVMRDMEGHPIINHETGRPFLKPLPQISLLDIAHCRFPAGLAGHVCESAPKDIHIDVLDERVKPSYGPDQEALDEWWKMMRATNGFEERDFQVESVRLGLECTRGLFVLATGAGKTATAMGIVAGLPGIKWLFVVPNITLYKQAIDTYEECFPGEKAGRIHKQTVKDGNFVVVTYQTLHSKLKKGHPEVLTIVSNTTGVIVDECHRAAAKTQYDALLRLHNAYYRFGLSATALMRSDRQDLKTVGVLGRPLIEIKTHTLVKMGILAKPIITIIPVVQGGPTSKDWQEDYDIFVTRSGIRMHALMGSIYLLGEAPGIIFCQAPEHGHRIQTCMDELGYRTQFVWGKSTGHVREVVKRDLVNGTLDYIITSTIFDEGLDIRSIRSMFLAGGRKGDIRILQRIGRGVRRDPKTGKVMVKIYDIMDMVADNAPPHESGNSHNANHSLDRLRIFKAEKHEVRVLPT